MVELPIWAYAVVGVIAVVGIIYGFIKKSKDKE